MAWSSVKKLRPIYAHFVWLKLYVAQWALFDLKKFLEELNLSPWKWGGVGVIQAASTCKISFSLTALFRIPKYIHVYSYRHLESSKGSFKKP